MKLVTKNLTVSIGEGAAKKEFTGQVSYRAFETAEDVLLALQAEETEKQAFVADPENAGKTWQSSLIGHLNYSIDLTERAKVRAQIIATQAGPDKAFEGAAKMLVKAFAALGESLSFEDALATVKSRAPKASAPAETVAA